MGIENPLDARAFGLTPAHRRCLASEIKGLREAEAPGVVASNRSGQEIDGPADSLEMKTAQQTVRLDADDLDADRYLGAARPGPGQKGGPARAEVHRWMLDATLDPIVVIAPNNTFAEVNKAYCTATGLSREALIGASVREVVGVNTFDTFVTPALMACRSTGTADYWMTRHYRPDYAPRQHVMYSRIFWPGSSMPYVLIVARQPGR